jgi:hypothetical protein
MKTHAISFVLGAAAFAGLSYASGFHASAWTFAGGFCSAAILLGALMASRKRMRSVARFLDAVAGPAGRARKEAAPDAPNELLVDVTAALRKLGADSKAAAAAAQRAHELKPGAGFEDLFRAALPLVR